MRDDAAGEWRPRVGDRVRVRPGVGRSIPCRELHHYPEEERRIATVVAVRALAGTPHHPYLVEFDRPAPRVWIFGTEVVMIVRHYAADELEPGE